MERRVSEVFDHVMTTTLTPASTTNTADPALAPAARRAIEKHSFGVLATTSSQGRPHAAGVLYQLAGGSLWISTIRSSRKALNIADTGQAALSIPARRIPVGPPSTVQLQGRAELVELDDPTLLGLAADGRLDNVTGHGELELDDGVFVRLHPPRRVPLYGLGMSLWAFARDPLGASRVAEVDWA